MNIHAMNPKVGLPTTTIQPLQCVRRSKSEQIYQTSGLSNYTEEVQLSGSVFVRLTYAASDYI